jgi:hypothetical protein
VGVGGPREGEIDREGRRSTETGRERENDSVLLSHLFLLMHREREREREGERERERERGRDVVTAALRTVRDRKTKGKGQMISITIPSSLLLRLHSTTVLSPLTTQLKVFIL